MTKKYDENPHFHLSEATFSSKDEDLVIDEEVLQQYQKLISNIELTKKRERDKDEGLIPSFAKIEITFLLILSIFAFISAFITGYMGNISISTCFLIIGLGCLIGFLPLLYAIKQVD